MKGLPPSLTAAGFTVQEAGVWEEWGPCLISSSKLAHWRTEARSQEYGPGLSRPQTSVWGLSFCPLTSLPAVSTHATPIDGVDSAWLIISTFSLQVSLLTLCSICPKHERKCFASLWRSPSSPACGIGLQDLLSQVVFPGLPPASLAKGQTVQLPRRPFVHIGCHLGTPSLSHPTLRPQPFFNLPHSPPTLLSLTDVVFCPWKWPRGHIGCELPAERSPLGPPWLLRSPFTAQCLPPGPDVLLFVFCFDFGRKFVSDVTGAANDQYLPVYFSFSSTLLAP